MDKIYNVTYILKCRDGSFYTGWTNDMVKRYAVHVSGKGSKYTKSHPPEGIVYLEVSETKEAAMQREYAIKQMTRQKKVLMIAESDWQNRLPEGIREALEEHFC